MLESLPSMPALTELKADYLDSVSYSVGLKLLKFNYSVLTNADLFMPLTRLENLDLELSKFCKDFELVGLDGLHHLRTLCLHGYITDAHVDSVRSLSNLHTLRLHSKHMTDASLQSVSKLSNLTSLHFGTCYSMQVTPAGFQHLDSPTLTDLQLMSCYNITDLKCIAKLTNLQNLVINGSYLLRHLNDLSNFQQLRNLALLYCDSLTSLAGVNLVHTLQELDVARCWDLSESGLWDLLPCKLAKLSLNMWHARAKLGVGVSEFQAQLRASNPSVQLDF
jgi:hypothetical protein